MDLRIKYSIFFSSLVSLDLCSTNTTANRCLVKRVSLNVSVRPVTLIQPLTDLTVCEGDIAQLEVKFSQENVEGTWMKNGQPIAASNRVHIVIDKQIHKLLVEDTNKDDFGTYSFVVPAQEISTSAKLSIQSRLHIIC